jgi:hypothetical protein
MNRVSPGDDNQCVWHRKREDNPSASVSSQKFRPSAMIFAVIGSGYNLKLLRIEGTIDADKYIEYLLALGFIDDLHEAHGPFDWLEEKYDMIHDWPANSLNLSQIELLWAILKRFVRKLRPQTAPKFKLALETASEMITQKAIAKGFQLASISALRTKVIRYQNNHG